ncbi:hypothetical protein [Enterobacter sp. KBR-315C3_2022]|uniref:hypothetical protein n=1 Tax=Enterobacter sp. KBR-315C3_2022 TaxID=3242494 RepID=UPI0035289EFD
MMVVKEGSAAWCPHPGPLPRGEGENTKNGNSRYRFAFVLRDFFFHRSVEDKRIWPLRLNVAEKKHGGE